MDMALLIYIIRIMQVIGGLSKHMKIQIKKYFKNILKNLVIVLLKMINILLLVLHFIMMGMYLFMILIQKHKTLHIRTLHLKQLMFVI